MKKILAFMLSTLIFLGSCINISAAQTSELEKTNIKENNKLSTIVDQTNFKSIHPGEIGGTGFSVSLIDYSLSAHRETNGSVTVLINETFHTVRGYYEHLATDSSGDNFIPSKNTAYYTTSKGLYSINLPANTVSSDGYVYLKVAIAPIDSDLLYTPIEYKIPVDYDNYNTAKNSPNTLETGVEYTATFSAQIAIFEAKATKQADNSVEIFINLKMNNTNLWFKHSATSKDGDIYIPQKDTWYFLTSDREDDTAYRFILPESSISTDGYIYLSAQFDLPFGMYNAGSFKLPLLNA